MVSKQSVVTGVMGVALFAWPMAKFLTAPGSPLTWSEKEVVWEVFWWVVTVTVLLVGSAVWHVRHPESRLPLDWQTEYAVCLSNAASMMVTAREQTQQPWIPSQHRALAHALVREYHDSVRHVHMAAARQGNYAKALEVLKPFHDRVERTLRGDYDHDEKAFIETEPAPLQS